jgi:predicted nucleotidyltransferase
MILSLQLSSGELLKVDLLGNMKLQELLKEKREDILAVAARHGAFNIRVFGSVARGEETENSDIDLLVDYDLQKISPWFPVRLIRDLESLLSCKVDVVTEQGLKARIRERVLQECILL